VTRDRVGRRWSIEGPPAGGSLFAGRMRHPGDGGQGPPEAWAQVFVEDWPEAAFQVFVEGTAFGSGRYIRCRRDAAGRFVEVYDAVTGDGLEIGRVIVWAPGARLVLTWREPDWPAGASTDVEIRFEAMFGGTLVRVQHSGFDRLGPQAMRVGAEYRAAWPAALCWVAGRASPGRGDVQSAREVT
jgi:hypothetical protein